jgi:hypothetical protein
VAPTTLRGASAKPARRGRARLLSPAALIAQLAVLFYAAFIARTAFQVGGRTYFTLFDDAMVSMRFGRNLAEGGGLVWNPGGEHIEGYTNLLWTLWMAVVHLAGAGDAKASLVVMASGAAILVGNLFVVRALVAEIAPDREHAALAAMAATALFYPLAYWTLRGMEVGLVALLVALMALYALRLERSFDRRTLAKLAAVMAAGVLTRDDVLIPCAIVSAYVLLRCPARRGGSAAVLGGVLAATVGAHELFRLLYYDSLLPNTYALKMGGSALGDRVERGAAALANVSWASLYVPIALAGAALASRRRGVSLLVAIVAGQAVYSVYVGGDAWEYMGATNRFVTPAVPLLLAAAALGFAALLDGRARGRAAVVAGGLVVLGGLHAASALTGHAVVHAPEIAGGGALLPRQEVVVALGTALFAVTVALAAAARDPGARRAVWQLFAVALVVATSGAQLREWHSHNAAYASADATMARYGVELRGATSPDTAVAVAWAGAVPYFDRRPSVDLLGKSDRAIARMDPRSVPFHPGHTKWDYGHSVGALRPDVIAQLWRPGDSELALLRRLGYTGVLAPRVQGRPHLYVRTGARGIDRERLRRALPGWLAEG